MGSVLGSALGSVVGSLLGSVLGTVVSWAHGTCVVCVLGTVVCWAHGSRVGRHRGAPCSCIERQGVLVLRLLWRGRCLMVAGTLPDGGGDAVVVAHQEA